MSGSHFGQSGVFNPQPADQFWPVELCYLACGPSHRSEKLASGEWWQQLPLPCCQNFILGGSPVHWLTWPCMLDRVHRAWRRQHGVQSWHIGLDRGSIMLNRTCEPCRNVVGPNPGVQGHGRGTKPSLFP